MICNIILDRLDSNKCSIYLDEYKIKDKVINHSELKYLNNLGDKSINVNDIFERELSSKDFCHLANESILDEISKNKFMVHSEMLNEIKDEYSKILRMVTVEESICFANEMNYEINYIKQRDKYSSSLDLLFSNFKNK